MFLCCCFFVFFSKLIQVTATKGFSSTDRLDWQSDKTWSIQCRCTYSKRINHTLSHTQNGQSVNFRRTVRVLALDVFAFSKARQCCSAALRCPVLAQQARREYCDTLRASQLPHTPPALLLLLLLSGIMRRQRKDLASSGSPFTS